MMYQCSVSLKENRETHLNISGDLIFHPPVSGSSERAAENRTAEKFSENLEDHVEIRCDPAIGR
jgi:hypothetical protein